MELHVEAKKFGNVLNTKLNNHYASSSSAEVDFLSISQQLVFNLEDLVNGENLLNKRQCAHLSSKLSQTVANVQELVVNFEGSMYISRVSFENLYRILEKARALIIKCCKVDWIRESIFQIGNKKDFEVILFEVGLCYGAIFNQAKCKNETSFQHNDPYHSSSFGHASISDVQKDQEDLKRRLEDVINQQRSSKSSLKDNLELEQCLARYLLMIWEYVSQPSETNEFNISMAILWNRDNEPNGTWGNDKYIGGGATGGVVGSRWMDIPCAKKIFHEEDLKENSFLNEARILFNLNHPNVVKFFCCGNEHGSSKCFIAMELAEMSLAKLIHCQANKGTPFSFLVALDIIVQIARGMYYLHLMGVAHRDLKPHNVVVNTLDSSHVADQYFVKLVDFDMSKTKVEASKFNTMTAFGIGTTRYRAPELHRKAHPEGSTAKAIWFKADVYSFAIICAQILSLEEPFKGVGFNTLYEELIKGVRPKIPSTCPMKLVELVNDCWDIHSSSRPNFEKICKKLEEVRHDFLKGLSIPNENLQAIGSNSSSCQTTKISEKMPQSRSDSNRWSLHQGRLSTEIINNTRGDLTLKGGRDQVFTYLACVSENSSYKVYNNPNPRYGETLFQQYIIVKDRNRKHLIINLEEFINNRSITILEDDNGNFTTMTESRNSTLTNKGGLTNNKSGSSKIWSKLINSFKSTY